MRPSTICLYHGEKISAADAIQKRRRRGVCLECGRPVRATTADAATEPWFRHYRKNPDCSFSLAEPVLARPPAPRPTIGPADR
jgi:hypothetical protein